MSSISAEQAVGPAADSSSASSEMASHPRTTYVNPVRELAPPKPLGEPVIELFGIGKTYQLDGGARSVSALRDINLHASSPFGPIRRGEFVMLRGPSGGGKTTLLNMIGTIDRPTSGHIRLFGELVDSGKSDSFLSSLRLNKIGWIFQSWNCLSTLSAYENVELPMAIAGKLSASERKARAKGLLKLVGLEDRMAHLIPEMSGGEQQRVAIARSLCNSPLVLLADEPTASLDVANTCAVMDLLLRINQESGLTLLLVSHNPDLEVYADRILYLQDGTIVSEAVNTSQNRLDADAYTKFLNSNAAE